MSGAGHLLGCRDEWQKSLVMPVTTMHWQENSFPKMTKETRFSLRTERQLKGTFTTWNLINVKTWVKISFRNGSCPGGLLSDVVVLQSHFPSLLKCLAAWEKEKQSHMKLFRGLSFLFSFIIFSCNCFWKVSSGPIFFFFSFPLFFYLSLLLFLTLPFLIAGEKNPPNQQKTPKNTHPRPCPKNKNGWRCALFILLGKMGSKSKVLAWPCSCTTLSVVWGFRQGDLCLPNTIATNTINDL